MFQMSAATAAVQAVEGQTIGLLDRDRRLSLQMDKLEVGWRQGDYDGRGHPTVSPMLTAIMSGGVAERCTNIGSLYIIRQHNSSTP